MLPSVQTLVERRRALQLTQKRVAQLIRVNNSTLSAWERGQFRSLRYRALLSHLFDCLESGRPILDDDLRAINESAV